MELNHFESRLMHLLGIEEKYLVELDLFVRPDMLPVVKTRRLQFNDEGGVICKPGTFDPQLLAEEFDFTGDKLILTHSYIVNDVVEMDDIIDVRPEVPENSVV